LDSSVVLDLAFALRTRGDTEANVKSTTLTFTRAGGARKGSAAKKPR
jgi:hypothetical protein